MGTKEMRNFRLRSLHEWVNNNPELPTVSEYLSILKLKGMSISKATATRDLNEFSKQTGIKRDVKSNIADRFSKKEVPVKVNKEVKPKEPLVKSELEIKAEIRKNLVPVFDSEYGKGWDRDMKKNAEFAREAEDRYKRGQF